MKKKLLKPKTSTKVFRAYNEAEQCKCQVCRCQECDCPMPKEEQVALLAARRCKKTPQKHPRFPKQENLGYLLCRAMDIYM